MSKPATEVWHATGSPCYPRQCAEDYVWIGLPSATAPFVDERVSLDGQISQEIERNRLKLGDLELGNLWPRRTWVEVEALIDRNHRPDRAIGHQLWHLTERAIGTTS